MSYRLSIEIVAESSHKAVVALNEVATLIREAKYVGNFSRPGRHAEYEWRPIREPEPPDLIPAPAEKPPESVVPDEVPAVPPVQEPTPKKRR